jgi:uncharacterized protein (DUF924 family)
MLTFWFDEVAPERMFTCDDAVDAQIVSLFGNPHNKLAALA